MIAQKKIKSKGPEPPSTPKLKNKKKEEEPAADPGKEQSLR